MPAAISGTVYTVAVVNNAFQREPSPFFQAFGSHVSTLIF